MPAFPFISLAAALRLLRVVTPALFMLHALVRIANGSIPQFGEFMESAGFPNGVAVVWAITVAELGAGLGLMIGYRIRLMAAVLFGIAATGIVLIHRHQGWFVGEHGTGGSEYSVALLCMLVVVAATAEEGEGFGVSRVAST
ncbi:MAG TPA: DoxX family protein [Gemmatimonadales bacterium]|nr:DoxX family protein [Gemmatimonadales bacterium]